MNLTLMTGLWRQRLTSPMRAGILALMVMVPPTLLAFLPAIGLQALGDGFPIAMVFAVGMIGQDVSSGVLQLVFARPVRRWEYVISRWLAAAIGASAVSVVQIAVAWAVLVARQAAPDPATVAWFALGREFEIFGVVAVMALFSSLIGGVGDLAVFVVLNITGGILALIGQLKGGGAALWIGQELGALLSPRIELAQILAGTPSWMGIATYASNLALCLVLAIVVMNRKELSYASG